MKILVLLFKGFKKIINIGHRSFGQLATNIILTLNGVNFAKGLKSRGIPNVDVSLTGSFSIGNNFKMNNGNRYNKIGRQQKCFFIVGNKGQLIIGNNVGISSTALICEKKIVIGDFVKIGGNVVIYDTDFHSLNPELRKYVELESDTNKKEVIISNNVFIGAHSTILKGVHIGENSIIGAGSVVTRSIPDNEIWAGNPVKFIRKLEL